MVKQHLELDALEFAQELDLPVLSRPARHPFALFGERHSIPRPFTYQIPGEIRTGIG